MKILNLVNERYGKLVVLKKMSSNKNKQVQWECLCDCGKTKIATTSHLRSRLKDCGCGYTEKRGHPYKSHGLSKKIPEYAAWENMKRRCYYKKHNRSEYYSKKGIKVCDRWLNSFENFFEDMGSRPSLNHSLDRFPNMNGNYEPSNCRWATDKEQSRNKNNTVYVTINGVKRCLQDWLSFYNIGISTVNRRRKAGWALDEKLFIHINKKNPQSVISER